LNAHILSLACVTPKAKFSQKNIANTFDKSLKLGYSTSKKLQAIFEHSKIETRHSVISDYENDFLSGEFFGSDFPKVLPCTHERNKVYIKEAPKLCLKACKKAINAWGLPASHITHVISVSCTGMYAPGLEFGLIKDLELNPNIERLGINFMGCFGAFKGLSIAKALAKENPENRILLVCTELCSLHFQADVSLETFVANALFADGAAASIIGCKPQDDETSLFEIEKNSSYALKDTEDHMSWEIANTGMLMKLSAKVPQMIEQHIIPFVKGLLGKNLSFESCEWAIHPGGKTIVENIEKSCNLNPAQTRASWKTLHNFGNMSSATFLFVLHEISQSKNDFKPVVGLGFGPGLSIEGILLRKTP
jgi:predicted naringenin-chalcone synthase